MMLTEMQKAENAIARAYLWERFKELDASDAFLYGFIEGEDVFAIELTMDELEPMVKLSKSSTDGDRKLKLMPLSQKRKAEYLLKAFRVGTVTELDALREDKWNRGEAFERLIRKVYGLAPWRKDKVRFDLGSDVVINGRGYSLKFGEATLVEMKSVRA